jgi:hypothetical protein
LTEIALLVAGVALPFAALITNNGAVATPQTFNGSPQCQASIGRL